ncbi:hypothetical protein ACIOBL_01390 [Paenibacillus taichungensis]|uniref:hypothetical protein n=1 Tax=Paenibacillus taichungensis TaxID=484184 RepID=UPI003806C973
MSEEKVTAKTIWVWTEQAEKLNPNHSRAGVPIWYQHQKEARKEWLDKGIIIDAEDFNKEGQTTIDDFM